MKTLAIALMSLFLVASCNGDKKEAPEQKPDKVEEAAPEKAEKPDKIEYPTYDGKYYSVKECKAKIAAAGGDACSTCEAIAEFMLSKFSCGAGEVTIDLACTAAEIAFFPEGDPIVVPLCTAFEVSFGVLCATYGQQWIDDNKHEAAKWMCNKAGLC